MYLSSDCAFGKDDSSSVILTKALICLASILVVVIVILIIVITQPLAHRLNEHLANKLGAPKKPQDAPHISGVFPMRFDSGVQTVPVRHGDQP